VNAQNVTVRANSALPEKSLGWADGVIEGGGRERAGRIDLF